jgi:hypothetical protein
MTSKSILTECAENALTEIQRIESQIVALHYACCDIRKDYSYEQEAIKDFSALNGSLYRRLNEAYRKLFMFGVVSTDNKMLHKAREKAFEHYLGEKNSIMGYLGFKDSWECELEDRFRSEIKCAKEKFDKEKKNEKSGKGN